MIRKSFRFIFEAVKRWLKTREHVSKESSLHLSGDSRRKRPARGERLVNVGIDFGTCSTKVFMRDISARQAYACAFGNALEEFGPFCWPSTVRIDEGRLFFGIPAEQMKTGRAIRSFKLCIACERRFFDSQDCPARQCNHSNYQTGRFDLGDDGTRRTFQAWELACLYLANLMNTVTQECAGEMPFDENCRWTYNMVAPLDMVEVSGVGEAFEKVLYFAHQIQDKVRQGIGVEDAKDLLNKVSGSTTEIPGREVRQTFVIPETHAAMVGYIISGKAEPGLYAAIDVGAGSTDVAIFRYCSESAERDVAYYSARTVLLGGNAIDRAICELLEKHKQAEISLHELLVNVRYSKHTFDQMGEMVVGAEHLGHEVVCRVVEPVLEKLFTHYRQTWGCGYMKENKPYRWEDLNLLLLGGCSRLSFVQRKLTQNPSSALHYIVKHINPRSAQLPRNIKVIGPSERVDINRYADLLTIAHGLSFHIAENPEYFTPKEVPPLPVRPVIADENKPSGHWW